MNIYCISTATKNIIMEVPEKIQIYMLSVALAYDGIFIEIFLKTPDQRHLVLKYFHRHFLY